MLCACSSLVVFVFASLHAPAASIGLVRKEDAPRLETTPPMSCLAAAKEADNAPSRAVVQRAMDLLFRRNVCQQKMRLGGDRDGGYIMCQEGEEKKSKVTALLSLGIQGSDTWGDEAGKAWGVPVFQFDCFDKRTPTCKSPAGCHFFAKCIVAPSEVKKKALEHPGHDFITIDDAATLADETTKTKGGDFIMKMDIETSEYGMLKEMPVDLLNRFQQITGEWHPNAMPTTEHLAALEKLGAAFYPVHFHPNDCCKPWKFMEFCMPGIYEASYLRKLGNEALEDVPGAPEPLPLKLDAPNGGPHQYHMNMFPYSGRRE